MQIQVRGSGSASAPRRAIVSNVAVLQLQLSHPKELWTFHVLGLKPAATQGAQQPERDFIYAMKHELLMASVRNLQLNLLLCHLRGPRNSSPVWSTAGRMPKQASQPTRRPSMIWCRTMRVATRWALCRCQGSLRIQSTVQKDWVLRVSLLGTASMILGRYLVSGFLDP